MGSGIHKVGSVEVVIVWGIFWVVVDVIVVFGPGRWSNWPLLPISIGQVLLLVVVEIGEENWRLGAREEPIVRQGLFGGMGALDWGN
jgi:hypothetical protein